MATEAAEAAARLTVHLTQLDALVADYLFYHGAADTPLNGDASEGYSAYKDYLPVLMSLREAVLTGDLRLALEMFEDLPISVPPQTRQALHFAIERQLFVELVRSGATHEAIEFARTRLSVDAATATATAYTEFKQTFALLLFEHPEHGPLADEWTLARRAQLASRIHASLLAALGTPEPRFTFFVRHLCATHNTYHVLKGIDAPYRMIERLLLPDRLPQSDGPVPTGNNRMWDRALRALGQTVGISRDQALRTLAESKWSTTGALFAQLALIQLRHPLLVSLALEYAGHRGLVNLDTPAAAMFRPATASDAEDANASLSPGPSKRRRPTGSEDGSPAPSTTPALPTRAVLERLRSMRDGLARGSLPVRDVASEALALAPTLPDEHPALYFRLRQCEVAETLASGNLDHALELFRSVLGPIAQDHPELAPELSRTAALLVFNPRGGALPSTVTLPDPRDLVGPLYAALGQLLSLSEPSLLTIVRYLLYVHEQSRVNELPDPFAPLFGIPDLRRAEDVHGRLSTPRDWDQLRPQIDESFRDAAPEPAAAPAPAAGVLNPVVDAEARETAITTLMAVMSYSRERATQLLRMHHFDLDEVFAHILP